jgi:hypothetical protein
MSKHMALVEEEELNSRADQFLSDRGVDPNTGRDVPEEPADLLHALFQSAFEGKPLCVGLLGVAAVSSLGVGVMMRF